MLHCAVLLNRLRQGLSGFTRARISLYGITNSGEQSQFHMREIRNHLQAFGGVMALVKKMRAGLGNVSAVKS